MQKLADGQVGLLQWDFAQALQRYRRVVDVGERCKARAPFLRELVLVQHGARRRLLEFVHLVEQLGPDHEQQQLDYRPGVYITSELRDVLEQNHAFGAK
ncbi:DUF2855 family protein [Babesia caballi]|uniref:DUF2855 family protein n=1 Tax=Babesia caballi TaxID=5871 RepID=A0AAV4LV70_BABCB|nr:DUF2855 family protein [Babesia caballi]